MSNPLPISVAIIAKNEEKNLKRLLPDIQDFAEEIVLVYNDCEDETVKVAQEYGVCCYEEAWRGYKEQKNLALLKCSKEWILCLDADEVLSDKLKESIRNFLSSDKLDSYNGASCNRCSFFMNRWIRHGDWYPDKKCRLLKSSAGSWSGGQLHEYLDINGKVFHLSGDLLHYSYDSILDFPQKMSVYANAFVEQNLKCRTRVSSFDLWVRPIWRFFRAFVLRLGFMDGLPGFIISISNTYECMLKYNLLKEKLNKIISNKMDKS